jgi:hypothetical protein
VAASSDFVATNTCSGISGLVADFETLILVFFGYIGQAVSVEITLIMFMATLSWVFK